MIDEIKKLDPNFVQTLELMHGDLAAALESLPDFGYTKQNHIEDIQNVQNVLNELRMVLQYYIYTHNIYHETFTKLLTLLKEAGVSQCVDDLITVRRNVRKHSAHYAEITVSANDPVKATNFN